MKSGTDWALEEEAIAFLRANDPLFKSKKKKKIMTYNYHSPRQQRIRKGKEIPFSNMSTKQKMACPRLGDSVTYEEA